MTDIFLSYNENDRDEARRIAALLESVGWTVWWDRRIPAGQSWRSVLEKALANMRCMVVLWSAHSVASEWVYEEASEGRRQRKLFPVLIADVLPPTGFREIQAADLSAWDGSAECEGMRLLIGDLAAFLGTPATTSGASSDKAADGGSDDERRWPRWPFASVRTWAAAGVLVAAGGLGVAYFERSPAPPPTLPSVDPSPQRTPGELPPGPLAPGAGVPLPNASAAPVPSPNASAASSLSALPSASGTATVLAPTRAATATLPGSTRRSRVAPTPAASSRCADLLARIQLGEPLAAAEQAGFKEECRQ